MAWRRKIPDYSSHGTGVVLPESHSFSTLSRCRKVIFFCLNCDQLDLTITLLYVDSLQWRYNECDGVSNHQPHDCLFNSLFRRRPKNTPKLRVTGLCEGNSPVTGDCLRKGPVTRKMLPFNDVIVWWGILGTGRRVCALLCRVAFGNNQFDIYLNPFFHGQFFDISGQ